MLTIYWNIWFSLLILQNINMKISTITTHNTQGTSYATECIRFLTYHRVIWNSKLFCNIFWHLFTVLVIYNFWIVTMLCVVPWDSNCVIFVLALIFYCLNKKNYWQIWNHPDVLYHFLRKRNAGSEAVDLDLEETAGAMGPVLPGGTILPVMPIKRGRGRSPKGISPVKRERKVNPRKVIRVFVWLD